VGKCGKTHKKRRAVAILLAIAALLILVLLFFNRYVNPVIIDSSEASVRSLTAKSMGAAITSALTDSAFSYDDLIHINKDNEGKIRMIQANALKINLLARTAAMNAQANIDAAGSRGIQIPVGTLTGMPIFAGKGFTISVKFVPIGSVAAEFRSEFSGAGINQTLHRIYIRLRSDVDIVLPTTRKSLSTATEMMVAESIVIGEVPNAYLQYGNIGGILNLVP